MRGQDVLRAVFELRDHLLRRLSLRGRQTPEFLPHRAAVAVGATDALPTHIAAAVALSAGDGLLELLQTEGDGELIVRLTPLGLAEGERLLDLDNYGDENRPSS